MAWTSRQFASSWLAWFFLCAGVPLAWWARSAREAEHVGWPVLEVHAAPRGGLPVLPPTTKDEDSARLLLSTLTDDERESWADDLEALIASEEARRNPALVDFLDLDPEESLRQQRPWLLPALSAGSALLAGHWVADDLEVTLVRGMGAPDTDEPTTTAPGSQRFAAWPLPSRQPDPTLRRAYLLAWPLVHAVLIDTANAPQARRAAEILRPESRLATSWIALVLDQRSLADTDPGDYFRARATLAIRCAEGTAPQPKTRAFTTLLRAICTPGPESTLKWLRLNDCQLLVVPRLRAFADRGSFLRQLRDKLSPLSPPVALSNVPTVPN